MGNGSAARLSTTRTRSLDVPSWPDLLQQPLGVAHRGHVRIGHQTDEVGRVQRRGRTRRDLVADVDHDVFVVAAEDS